ncbi:MAG: multidrug efflux RND transporter permease subunit [Methylacidiphilales bacterium]|nr:multidrug efflux RND transporter permease subunit [Candidatus Methylacidiphilales bacterium]
MSFPHFFIGRPVFAAVLSIVIVIVGAISLIMLPVAQYPEIVPPTIQVTTSYPGANAQTVADTVASPIEDEVNGVENMLYMSSQCTNDGQMTLTITFKLGTNLDTAQVLVQNRVAIALPKLPQDVQRQGVNTKKQSPDLTMVVHLISPDGRYNQLYLSNYAYLQIKDTLTRLYGVGDVKIFGARDYSMRIWLDPDKIASRNLTASDVVNAIREQNVQVAAGVLGLPPAPKGTQFQLTLNTMGRLVDPHDFENIVIKTGSDGKVTLLKDVARVELGALDNTMDSMLDGKPAVAMVLFELPGSNSLATSDAVRATMNKLKERFPPGIDYRIIYDTTMFERESIQSVVQTLFEAIGLVVLVVIVFLQTWRAAIIPLVAVPVSLIGTFAAMEALDFSLNNLSLFGLVLAIGIVVDDAIVVVENVERNLESGLSSVDATHKAMQEVTGPVIATALVLSAVFIPTAFISGITGQFYRQFALTIAVSTVISAFVSLTLSPAMCAILLQKHDAKPDMIQRVLDLLIGWFFHLFNWAFEKARNFYVRIIGRLVCIAPVVLAVYVGLLGLTWYGFQVVPSGFIPMQDQGYLISVAQLPDAASLERTEAVVHKISDIARKTPGIYHSVEFPGFSVLSGTSASNAAAVFFPLQPFSQRDTPALSANGILGKITPQFFGIPEGIVLAFPPPAVRGIGSVGGFKIEIQDRTGSNYNELDAAVQHLVTVGNKTPGLTRLFTTFRAHTPQLYIDIDRAKAKAMNVALSDIFSTLQIYLGSLYVNDFTLFNRTYQVTAQADSMFRLTPEDIGKLKTRNAAGDMVPLSTLVTVRDITGPDRVLRYNMYPSAEITGSAAPGVSSGQAKDLMENLAKKELPPSMGYEWTELTFQEILAGNTAVFVFPLCVLFVFLTLAAQYESWSLPFTVILIVPMCLLSAIWGVWLRSHFNSGMDNNIFTQIGLVVLIGLACKNAILIVEFAKKRQEVAGDTRRQAALEAARLRVRPIMMTSFSFILGVVPLVLAAGAGAEMRQALGTAVFFGMVGVTFFGTLFTPVFYVVVRWLTDKRQKKHAPAPAHHLP